MPRGRPSGGASTPIPGKLNERVLSLTDPVNRLCFLQQLALAPGDLLDLLSVQAAMLRRYHQSQTRLLVEEQPVSVRVLLQPVPAKRYHPSQPLQSSLQTRPATSPLLPA